MTARRRFPYQGDAVFFVHSRLEWSSDGRQRERCVKRFPADGYSLRGTFVNFFLVGGKGLEPLTVGV